MAPTLQRTLTREQRDLVWHEGQFYFPGDDPERDWGRERLLAHITRIEDLIGLYDDLGWEETDERDSYELTLAADRLERVLRALLEDAEYMIGEYEQAVGGDLWGDDDYWGYKHGWIEKLRADGLSDEQIRAELTASAERARDEGLKLRAACLAVLEGVA
jgi:hypothetical protein